MWQSEFTWGRDTAQRCLRTAIGILLKAQAAKPLREELQLAADLGNLVSTLYERCEEALRIARNVYRLFLPSLTDSDGRSSKGTPAR